MRKLYILTAIVLFFAFDLPAQKQAKRINLSDQHNFFEGDSLKQLINTNLPKLSTLKEGVESKKRLDSIVNYTYASNNESIRDSKIYYNYDGSGNQTLMVHYFWDSDQNNWVGLEKDEYTYDEAGNQTLYAY